MHVNDHAWECACLVAFAYELAGASGIKSPPSLSQRRALLPEITPMILSATDDKHFSTFISWLCSFWFCTRQDTSPLCSVTVGAVTEEQGSYKQVGCARWEWDSPPLHSPAPSHLVLSQFGERFTNKAVFGENTTKETKQVCCTRKGHSPGEPPPPGCPQT